VIALLTCPVFPVSAPVIRLFSARAFSLAISMTFPVFGVLRRPVNRLYFFSGLLWSAQAASRARGKIYF
jgi:hypothetical protein